MRMDCHEVEDRMAAWLDAELSPGEAELIARHLEHCPACAATMRRMEAQAFPRLHLPDVGAPGFWDRMDAVLDREQERRVEAEAAPAARAASGGWLRGEVRLPRATLLAYAALLVLAVGVAAWQGARATMATSSLAELELRVEREQRLAASPRAELPVEPVGLAAHTPFRGSL